MNLSYDLKMRALTVSLDTHKSGHLVGYTLYNGGI